MHKKSMLLNAINHDQLMRLEGGKGFEPLSFNRVLHRSSLSMLLASDSEGLKESS